MLSVTSPSPMNRMMRGSIWAPQAMSHPLVFAGWETVANHVVLATCCMTSASTSAVNAGVRRDGPLRMGGVVAVKAEDRVEVDQPAPLQLGDLGVRELDPRAVSLGELVQAAADGDDGAPPQLGRASVPYDGPE